MSEGFTRTVGTLAWRSDRLAARRYHAFALAEHGSMLDLRLAAGRTESAERAAAYLKHADDESRHAQMFGRHASRLAAPLGLVLGPVRADSERLFEALGERDFLAFVHVGEMRARRQFEAYVEWFNKRGRAHDVSLFEAILVDERRHERYTREFLTELVGEVEARRALRRVARWEFRRRWLRAGRFLAERVYVLAMLLVYVLAAPLALLVRAARPVRRGWQPVRPE